MNSDQMKRKHADRCELCGAIPGKPHHQPERRYARKPVVLHMATRLPRNTYTTLENGGLFGPRTLLVLCSQCRDGQALLYDHERAVDFLLTAITDLGLADIYTDAPEYSGRVDAMRASIMLLRAHVDRGYAADVTTKAARRAVDLRKRDEKQKERIVARISKERLV